MVWQASKPSNIRGSLLRYGHDAARCQLMNGVMKSILRGDIERYVATPRVRAASFREAESA